MLLSPYFFQLFLSYLLFLIKDFKMLLFPFFNYFFLNFLHRCLRLFLTNLLIKVNKLLLLITLKWNIQLIMNEITFLIYLFADMIWSIQRRINEWVLTNINIFIQENFLLITQLFSHFWIWVAIWWFWHLVKTFEIFFTFIRFYKCLNCNLVHMINLLQKLLFIFTMALPFL